jgi:hypothetical protein
MRLTPAAALALLAACADGPAPDSLPADGGCPALGAGTWDFAGPAWGTAGGALAGDVTTAADPCAFALTGWSAPISDLPTGGRSNGDLVQLDGLDSYWRSCVGTAADAEHVAGTCTEDDAAWSMAARAATDPP